MGNTRKSASAEDASAVLRAAVRERLRAAGCGPGGALCVALSGGLDSVVLLDLLAGLRGELGYALEAAHVQHGLSSNADAWLASCASQCEARGVALHALHVHVPRNTGQGIEAAAREARHAALATLPCDWLVLAHHRNDQAETLLFRLLRGAGVRGSGAMRLVEAGRPGRLRPLLDVPREALRSYALAAGLQWVEDESNEDCRFRRNFLRHRVMPLLEQAFPGAIATLARAAAHFQEADTLLEELAALDRSACGGMPMDRAAVCGLSRARQRNLIRHCLRLEAQPMPTQEVLDEALRQLGAAADPLYFPLGALALCAYREQVWLESTHWVAPEAQPWSGDATLCWGDGALSFGVGAGGLMLPQEPGRVVLAGRSEGIHLQLAPGRPVRSFKKLCQERGIPSWMRERLPVLYLDGVAVWVGGLGADARYLAAPDANGWRIEWPVPTEA